MTPQPRRHRTQWFLPMLRGHSIAGLGLAFALGIGMISGAAAAQEKQPARDSGAKDAAAKEAAGKEAAPKGAKAQPAEAPKEAPKDAASAAKAPLYCTNIADAAADARFAWQKETLLALEKQIEERIALLETKRAEYEEWLRRREEFLRRADEGIVAIYSRMRPDAAALQLANMDDETAAAVLTKLNPRSASAILNEMEPARAAKLAHTMAGAANRPPSDGKSG